MVKLSLNLIDLYRMHKDSIDYDDKSNDNKNVSNYI